MDQKHKVLQTLGKNKKAKNFKSRKGKLCLLQNSLLQVSRMLCLNICATKPINNFLYTLS